MIGHPTDDLELYAMEALGPEERAAIDTHLAGCAACAAQVRELAAVVDALPGAVPLREPPPQLRARVLASANALAETVTGPLAQRSGGGLSEPSAGALVAPTAAPWARPAAPSRPAGGGLRSPGWMRRVSWVASAVLATAVLVLAAVDLRALDAQRSAAADRDRYLAMAERLGDGGRTWYMAGSDAWTGSGGLIVAPRTSGPPYVVFRDLRALGADEHYAVWLISPDDRWVRAANFSPDGTQLQLIDLQVSTNGFDRCALTVEHRNEGSREGAVIMQSRIAPPVQ
ncbi:MAG: anti-sigma factor domain-containing protein [Candidatus Limnocylindria bacterium]